MNERNETTPPERRFDGLDLETSTRLLRLGLAGSGRPVDELSERLENADGHRWLRGLVGDEASPLSRLARWIESGDTSLENLTRLKNESKGRMENARDRETRLECVAEYFFSIAAALVHHDALLSSHRARDLTAVYLDLAAVSPAPWDGLFTRASWSCQNRDERSQKKN